MDGTLRLHRWLAVAAVLVVVAQGMLGAADLALYAMPTLLIVAMLLSGRFVGEERILARWRRSAPVRAARPVRTRWRGLPERAFVSLFERSVQLERGPPAVAVHSFG